MPQNNILHWYSLVSSCVLRHTSLFAMLSCIMSKHGHGLEYGHLLLTNALQICMFGLGKATFC